MIQQYAMSIAVFIVIAVNGLWYAAKMFLVARGVPVRWFSGHFQDLISLRELAEGSANQSDKNGARNLLWALRTGMFLFLFVGVPLFFWGAVGRQQ